MRYKVIVLVLSIVLIKVSIAQLPAPGSNINRPELDKFAGTWKWSDSAGSEVTVQLKKISFYFENEDYHEDVLLGSHEYIRNGLLIQNYLLQFPTVSQDHQSSIFVWYTNAFGPNHIRGNILDESKHKKDNLTLDYIAGLPPSLIWHVSDLGGFIVLPMLPGVTLPENLQLVKQWNQQPSHQVLIKLARMEIALQSKELQEVNFGPEEIQPSETKAIRSY